MVNVCEKFGEHNDVRFNPKKSECILFSRARKMKFDHPSIFLSNKKIEWVERVRHLGNFLQSNLCEKIECTKKTNDFTFHVNMLRSNFRNCNHRVLLRLFNNYCLSFHGCQAWQFEEPCFQSVNRKWRKALRLLLQLPYNCHSRFIPVIACNNNHQILYTLLQRHVKMIKCMSSSHNSVVRNVTMYLLNDPRSIMSCNRRNLGALSSPSLNDEETAICIGIRELLECRDSFQCMSDFTRQDIDLFITELSTM